MFAVEFKGLPAVGCGAGLAEADGVTDEAAEAVAGGDAEEAPVRLRLRLSAFLSPLTSSSSPRLVDTALASEPPSAVVAVTTDMPVEAEVVFVIAVVIVAVVVVLAVAVAVAVVVSPSSSNEEEDEEVEEEDDDDEEEEDSVLSLTEDE